jgi:hypothetical protein
LGDFSRLIFCGFWEAQMKAAAAVEHDADANDVHDPAGGDEGQDHEAEDDRKLFQNSQHVHP